MEKVLKEFYVHQLLAAIIIKKSTAVDPRLTEARLHFEREIEKSRNMDCKVLRNRWEMTSKGWRKNSSTFRKDYKPKINIRESDDKITI
jgi:hypothetical protein